MASQNTGPTPQELFEKMQKETVGKYHDEIPLEDLKVSKDYVKKNEDVLVKHDVELHLDNDLIPSHQEYLLVSFVDPDEILNVKEVFCFGKFLNSFSQSLTEVFTQMEEQIPEIAQKLQLLRLDTYKHLFEPERLQNTYRFFKKDNLQQLNNEFNKMNKFRTSERGFKIRGAFGSFEEAQRGAQILKDKDDKFNIFIGKMGYWMPFNPPTDSIENQQYAIEELNTLMKSYKEQQTKQENDYEDRKRKLREIVELKEKPAPPPEPVPETQEPTEEIKELVEEVEKATV